MLDEPDLNRSSGAPPLQCDFDGIVDQHEIVEDYASANSGNASMAHGHLLNTLVAGNVPILIHTIEGGFQAGRATAGGPQERQDAGQPRGRLRDCGASGAPSLLGGKPDDTRIARVRPAPRP